MSNVVYLSRNGAPQPVSHETEPGWDEALANVVANTLVLSSKADDLAAFLAKADELIEKIADPTVREPLQRQCREDRQALVAALGELAEQVDKLQRQRG